ncbi:hypothetical protein M0R45_021847 [Rubus argutus]|uniref:Uncharacterized protein n=1 Tax=Rubus argutus TaxID=59490 RepID=A0AAW1XE60_RUBAR
MKQGKLAVFEKELSTGYFHVKTTVILSMSIALLVFLLGMFIIIIFLRNGVFIIDPTKFVATFLSPQLLPISTLPNPGDYIAPKELWHRRHRSPNTL